MVFLEKDFSVKILSVQHLSWKFNNTNVLPRPFNALSFRIKGNSRFSDNKTTVNLSDGDVLFMPKGVGYHLSSGEEEIIVVHFDIEGESQDYFESFSPIHPRSYENLFNDLLLEWQTREPGYYLKAMSIFYALLARIKRHINTADNPSYSKIKKSVEYLHRNFTDCYLNIDELCTLSNMSDTYFRKLFFEVYKSSPLKFINELRINYAAELLKTGYYTVETVSEKSGFGDSKYFSTVFKKYKNCSPSAYRDKYL